MHTLQIDNVEMSFRIMKFRIIALPFLTGYTRERCKEPKIGIERLIDKEKENSACFRGTISRVPESDSQ